MKGDVVLRAVGVTKFFPVKTSFGKTPMVVKAVDGVTLKLIEGETYGLVGETGCGKSTLGRTLIKLIEPTDGSISINGVDVTRMTEKEMRPYRKTVQMVFQDPYTSLNPRKRVGDALVEVLTIHHLSKREDRIDVAMKILAKVGLRPEHFYRYPHEFSGGQRQRIGLARALILNPAIVICDEPVSALDVSIQSQIINLLQDLQEQDRLTYLFIAHDMSVVKYISDRIGVMYLGHIVEEAETEALFKNTLHPYTQTLLSAVPKTDPYSTRKRIILQGDVPSPLNPPSGCVFHTRCPYAMKACTSLIPVLKNMGENHRVACLRYDPDLSTLA